MSLAFKMICPHCKEPTRAPAEAFYRWWPDEDEEGQVADSNRAALAAVASYCPECENPVALIVEGKDRILRPIMSESVESRDWGYFGSDLTLKEVVPKPVGLPLDVAVPERIRHVLPDLAEDVGRRRNAVGTLNLCRGVLEEALRELEQANSQTPNRNTLLVNRIDNLCERGIITKSVAEWAHEIRLDGNRSAHELVGDPDLAVVYLDFLKVFLEVAFVLPKKIEAVRTHKAQKQASPIGRPTGEV